MLRISVSKCFQVIAELTIAVVLIPQVTAYVLIARLPPQTDLHSAIMGSIVGGLW